MEHYNMERMVVSSYDLSDNISNIFIFDQYLPNMTIISSLYRSISNLLLEYQAKGLFSYLKFQKKPTEL